MSLETLIDVGLIAVGMVLVAFSGRMALAMNRAFYGEAVLPFREFMFRMMILVMGVLLVIAGVQDLQLVG